MQNSPSNRSQRPKRMLCLFSQAMKDLVEIIKDEFKFIKSNPESIIAVILILLYFAFVIFLAFNA